MNAGMPSILVIAASPHGYGHFHRGNLVSEFLSKCGFEVLFLTNTTNGSPIVTFQQHTEINVDMESGVISDASRDFLIQYTQAHSFDYVLFDHFPLGKLSLVNVFDILKKNSSENVKFICLFRDIFEDIDSIIPWCIKLLNKHFDRLLVCSDPKYLRLPSFLTDSITIPVDYLGYLDPNPAKKIIVFGGGGKYNTDFYQQTLEAIHLLALDKQFEVKLITGTMLSNDSYHLLRDQFKFVMVERFCKDMETEISNAAITISTLGYNTFVQLLKYNNNNIIVPMKRNEEEQNTRGKLLVSLKPGLCSLLTLSDHYKEELAHELATVINKQLNRNGLWNLRNQLIGD